jgi:cell division protein FtsI/penicillin-binding protein 2
MARLAQYRRLLWLAFLLALGFISLGYRLVDLQVLRHEDLASRVEAKTELCYFREPRRGDIRDCRGNLLATSMFVRTVCADLTFISNRYAEVACALAPVLEMDERGLIQRLKPRARVDSSGRTNCLRYVVLKRKVRNEQWQRIIKTMRLLSFGIDERKLTRSEQAFYRNLRGKAIFADPQEDQLRLYPQHQLAAHVLGYVATEERRIGMAVLREMVGKYGVEKALDSALSGVRGWRETAHDRRGVELLTLREQDVEPRDGLSVILTLDAGIQDILEQELELAVRRYLPASASAVAVRPSTGAILGMAIWPGFDPNTPGAFPLENLRNRVVSDFAEPGSTFKIVVVSGALNEGLVTLEDRLDCENGAFYYGGKVLHDHEHYGILSVEEIIAKSSNIGAAKIGIKMGAERLYRYVRGFGFGQRTGIVLGEGVETRGVVHPVDRWNKLSVSRIPMGHEVGVTPLQMIMAMSALANQGWLMRPMLIDRLEDEDGRVVTKFQPQPVRQVVSAATAKLMIRALKAVVSPKGTAPKASLDHYTVAGKTGTAQKIVAGQYVRDKHYSSFIGFFPADNPEICISVVLDEPQRGYYGGQTAAPIFRSIAERAANYLNIRPDVIPSGMLAKGRDNSGLRTDAWD